MGCGLACIMVSVLVWVGFSDGFPHVFQFVLADLGVDLGGGDLSVAEPPL